MNKYDPLRDYLRSQTLSEVALSFSEIEHLIGSPLPKSAPRRQWWENEKNPNTTHSQRAAWRDAGYDAFLTKDASKVRFKKVR
jgi:hypothetical protein